MDDSLKYNLGTVFSTPDLEQIQKDLKSHRKLLEVVLFEEENDIPKLQAPADVNGNLSIYLVAHEPPSRRLVKMAAFWYPTRLEWLNVVDRLEYLANSSTVGSIIYSNPILMVSWDVPHD